MKNLGCLFGTDTHDLIDYLDSNMKVSGTVPLEKSNKCFNDIPKTKKKTRTAQKIIRNGQLFIRHKNTEYDILGRRQ